MKIKVKERFFEKILKKQEPDVVISLSTCCFDGYSI